MNDVEDLPVLHVPPSQLKDLFQAICMINSIYNDDRIRCLLRRKIVPIAEDTNQE
jgi:hypothetical protein